MHMLDDFMSYLVSLQGGDLEQEHLYREFKSTKKNEVWHYARDLAQLEQIHASHKFKLADSETKTAKIRLVGSECSCFSMLKELGRGRVGLGSRPRRWD